MRTRKEKPRVTQTPSPPRASRLFPDPAAPLPAVWLRSLVRRPLVYRKQVARADTNAHAGDWVAVYTGDNELLGYGLYNPRSEIAVRMLSWGERLPDETFWKQRLEQAIALRRDLLRLDEQTDAYRLVHAEADGLSGLVVDRYGDVLSLETFSWAMHRRAPEIAQRMAELCGAKHWVVRGSPQFLSQEGFEPKDSATPELPTQATVQEFGTRFRVPFEGGHKTGFFCDQRDNRRLLASFCRDRSVLDLCCYTGGFAVQAARLGKAADVTAVDLDAEPLKWAKENANLNQVRVRFVQSDVFPYMRDMLRAERQYEVVVLDPPKLITSRNQIEEGTRKHFDLNRLAMRLVKPGGVLLTCSCAGLLDAAEFERLVYAAARQAGPEQELPDGTKRFEPRELQVLARTGAAADHPVSSAFPEGEYLKALWLRLG